MLEKEKIKAAAFMTQQFVHHKCRDSRAEEPHNPAQFWHEVTFKGRDLFPTMEEVLRIIPHLFLRPMFQRAEAWDNYSV